MKALFAVILALFLCGCSDVQERSHIVGGRTGTPLTASVGDTVLRVSREKNLPNIAWKADMFGRTTPTGVETVQYMGVKDGRAFFKRRTVDVETGATTMNSTPPWSSPIQPRQPRAALSIFTAPTVMALALIPAHPQPCCRRP